MRVQCTCFTCGKAFTRPRQGKSHHLGYFADESEAAEAARMGRLQLLAYAVD
jgi:hypothetical protein